MRRLDRDVPKVLVLAMAVMVAGCLDNPVVPVVSVPLGAFLYVQARASDPPRPPRNSSTTSGTTGNTTTTIGVAGTGFVCPPAVDDRNCADFRCQQEAQLFFDAVMNNTGRDCHDLDGDVPPNLRACETPPAGRTADEWAATCVQ
jgi:hypothetical protein